MRYYRRGIAYDYHPKQLEGVIIHSDGTIEEDPHAESNNSNLLNKIQHINSLEQRGCVDRESASKMIDEAISNTED